MKKWIVLCLNVGVFWPTKDTTVKFRNYEIILRPQTAEESASIAMAYEDPVTLYDALHVARQFLSSLVWVKGGMIEEIFASGGSFPIKVADKRHRTRHIDHDFRVDFLPDPTDRKGRLALALYREALSVNSVPYKFLGFYKIINIVYGPGRDQKDWINKTVPVLTDDEAKHRIDKLIAEGKDVGDHLYVTGRCAIAHAYAEPIVDPEDPEDIDRLHKDLPVAKALAAYLIENEFNVKRK